MTPVRRSTQTHAPAREALIATTATAIAEEMGWPAEDRERLGEAAIVWASRDDGHRPTLDSEQRTWIELAGERWDGSGPRELRGAEIPPAALLIGLADTWVSLLDMDNGSGDLAITACWRRSGLTLWPSAVQALTRWRARG